MNLYDRVKEAISNHPKILVDIDKVEEAEGHPEWLMADLGLERRHLKRLENQGLALRGYWPRRSTGFLSRRACWRGKWRRHKRNPLSYPRAFFDKKIAPKHAGFEVRWMLLRRPNASRLTK